MRTMGRCRLTSTSATGLETMLNNSLRREVLWNAESHTGTAITELLIDIAHQRGHPLPLGTDGRLRTDVPAIE